MKIACDIIKDILPLYLEGVVSNATKEMVVEHLADCEDCTAELEALKQPVKESVKIATNSLKRVENSIRRRRILAVLATIMTIASILLGISVYLKAPVFLKAREAIENAETREFGDVKIVWVDVVQAHAGYGTEQNYAHIAYTTRLDQLFAQSGYFRFGARPEHVSYIKNTMLSKSERFVEIDDVWEDTGNDMQRNHWYVDIFDGTADVLLWDAGKPASDQPIMETSYFMISLYGLSVMSAIIFAFSSKFAKKIWFKELCIRLSVLAAALFIAVLTATGGQISLLACQYSFFHIEDDLVGVWITFALTGFLYHKMYMIRKQDKG